MNAATSLRTADYDADYDSIRSIRFAVFVDEQQVPPEIEMDERDPHCIHLLATTTDGTAVGTARIDLGQSGKVGRLAVLRANRGHGIGGALMQALHEIAQQHELDAVWCHAQLRAVPFYERLGYVAAGDIFDEAGIDHVAMRKALAVPIGTAQDTG